MTAIQSHTHINTPRASRMRQRGAFPFYPIVRHAGGRALALFSIPFLLAATPFITTFILAAILFVWLYERLLLWFAITAAVAVPLGYVVLGIIGTGVELE